MAVHHPPDLEHAFRSQSEHFAHWEKLKDCIDQYIDIMLNYRQSGHPGGSRSKVHAMVSLLLSGAMRWDIRHPEKRFGDRFALVAGHTVPLIYATLPALAEPDRERHEGRVRERDDAGGLDAVAECRRDGMARTVSNLKQVREHGPLVIGRGDGVYLWDTDGKQYIDAFAGLWNVNVGHGRT